MLYHLSVFPAESKKDKPQVIVMTDGEIDDRSSMVRFLMYSCDINVRAIIETNSIYQKHGHSEDNWYVNSDDVNPQYDDIDPFG